MKANELNIGDWVAWNGRPIRLNRKDFREPKNTDKYTELDVFDSFLPIPLTEEILKVNGFNVDGIDKRFGTFVIYDWNEDGKYYSYICGEKRPLNYVHELQHALRLCWLYYLADNFKLNDK